MTSNYDGPEVPGRHSEIFILEFENGPAVANVCMPGLPIETLIDIEMRGREDNPIVRIRKGMLGGLLVNEEPVRTNHTILDFVLEREASGNSGTDTPGKIIRTEDTNLPEETHTVAPWLLTMKDGSEVFLMMPGGTSLSDVVDYADKNNVAATAFKQIYAGAVTINPALIAPGWNVVLSDLDLKAELKTSGPGMH